MGRGLLSAALLIVSSALATEPIVVISRGRIASGDTPLTPSQSAFVSAVQAGARPRHHCRSVPLPSGVAPYRAHLVPFACTLR